MRYLVLLVLFVLGAGVGVAVLPLLPGDVQLRIADFQQEARYTAGLDERPTVEGDIAPPAAPISTPRPTTTFLLRQSATPVPTSTPRPTATFLLR